jgi:Uma2 family endonuclease
MATRTLMTAEQLLELPDVPARRDLVEGELWEMAAAGTKHGALANRLGRIIGNYVEEHRLGETFGAETGFTLARNPDTVLAPDVAFVRADRVPATGIPDDYWEIAPDLVVEIVSPSDRAKQVTKKVDVWLAAGVQLVWVVYPRSRTVRVHRSGSEPRTLHEADILDGGVVLPDFTCPLARIWVR